ncbi:MAG TPA: TRAM domain-containing protein, partial [Spirochaetales bacterium]|nr:TRAM domain-containing protein [Spirochaetales bacterium]
LMGFPGETEEDVADTLRLLEEARFAYAYMYYYNPREGTKAVLMDGQVPTELKKERLARVIALQRSISQDIMKSLVGTELEVLAEGVSKKKEGELLCRTDHDMMVVVPASQSAIGTFMRVRLESLRGTTFRALEVRPCPGNS